MPDRYRTVAGFVSLLVTVMGLVGAARAGSVGAVTGSVSIPHTPFYYALGASLAIYGLLLASQLLLGLAVWNAEDPNEPDE